MSSGINLIRRSTGPLGDFKMPVCISLIVSETVLLSDEDIDVILSRYKEHVEFWNVSEQVVSAELENLAGIVARPLLWIFARYKEVDRGFWRQYLEPAYESGMPLGKAQHYVAIAGQLYLLDIEEQRNRTVVRVTLHSKEDMAGQDLVNIKNLAGCLAKRFQVWLHPPDVLEEYVRIFVSFTPEERRQRTGTLGLGIPVPVAELIECVNRCLTSFNSP